MPINTSLTQQLQETGALHRAHRGLRAPKTQSIFNRGEGHKHLYVFSSITYIGEHIDLD